MLNFIKNNFKKTSEIDIDQEISHFYNNQKKYLHHLIIFIVYRGKKLPKYCYPMLRKPLPKINVKINNNLNLAVAYFTSIKRNLAIEDGAILIQENFDGYYLKQYSCRIFPPHKKGVRSIANKGSGYNSSFYYSCVSRVEKVYFVNKEGVKKFVNGKEVEFKIEKSKSYKKVKKPD